MWAIFCDLYDPTKFRWSWTKIRHTFSSDVGIAKYGQHLAQRPKNSPLNDEMIIYRKTEVIQSYPRIWGSYDPFESDPSEPKKWGFVTRKSSRLLPVTITSDTLVNGLSSTQVCLLSQFWAKMLHTPVTVSKYARHNFHNEHPFTLQFAEQLRRR